MSDNQCRHGVDLSAVCEMCDYDVSDNPQVAPEDDQDSSKAQSSASSERSGLRAYRAPVPALVDRLMTAIRNHRDQRGDDRCWMDDEELYRALPEGYEPIERDTSIEIENCQRFIELRRNPQTEYVSPQREIERLRAALALATTQATASALRGAASPRPLNATEPSPPSTDSVATPERIYLYQLIEDGFIERVWGVAPSPAAYNRSIEYTRVASPQPEGEQQQDLDLSKEGNQ